MTDIQRADFGLHNLGGPEARIDAALEGYTPIMPEFKGLRIAQLGALRKELGTIRGGESGLAAAADQQLVVNRAQVPAQMAAYKLKMAELRLARKQEAGEEQDLQDVAGAQEEVSDSMFAKSKAASGAAYGVKRFSQAAGRVWEAVSGADNRAVAAKRNTVVNSNHGNVDISATGKER